MHLTPIIYYVALSIVNADKNKWIDMYAYLTIIYCPLHMSANLILITRKQKYSKLVSQMLLSFSANIN